LRRAPGRSGPRSSLVLRDILVCTKLILFCGPSYFGIFGKEPGNDIDGQDGIGFCVAIQMLDTFQLPREEARLNLDALTFLKARWAAFL